MVLANGPLRLVHKIYRPNTDKLIPKTPSRVEKNMYSACANSTNVVPDPWTVRDGRSRQSSEGHVVESIESISDKNFLSCYSFLFVLDCFWSWCDVVELI